SWRDIRVRYKQTAIGIAWAVIRPTLTMVIFTFVFGKVARFEQPGSIPYSTIVLAGRLPWQFLSAALSEASSSLIGNASLITKVYFPRVIIPTSSIIVALVDAAISFVVFLVVMAYYRYVPPPQLLALPVFGLLAFGRACGVGLCATALNVKYRDVRYAIPFIVQLGIYITPVGYSSSVIAQKYSEHARFWYS